MKRLPARPWPWRFRAGERRSLLILGDLLAGAAATFVALALWSQFDWFGFSWEFVRNRADWFILLPLVWILLMVNQYDLRRAASMPDSVRGIVLSAVVGVGLYMVAYFTSEPGSLPRRGVLYFLATVVMLTLAWRALYVNLFTAPAFMRRVLIVGAGDSGKSLVKAAKGIWPPPFFLVGLIDDDATKHGEDVNGVKVLGDNRVLLQKVDEETVSDIIVAILGPMNGEMFQALLDAQQRGVEITRMPVAYEELYGRVPIRHLEADWLLGSFVDEIRVSGFYLLTKRLFDILGALAGCFVLAVTFPFVAIATLLESGRPVLLRQARLGQGGRPFQALKFRTMRKDAEANGQAQWAQEQDPRVTRVGRILRKSHLDEFPQFLNVLTGSMSMVGPRPERPELVKDLEKEIPFYRARLLVKPGVTGWAQVSYGKGASVEGSAEKLEYDLYYIKHRSLLMDLWIVLRTVGSVLGFRGT